MLELHKLIRLSNVVACPIVFILFYDQYWQYFNNMIIDQYFMINIVLKLKKNYSIFSIISRYGHFPQVFGQVNEWPILKLQELIIVLHVVACPIVFV